MTKFTYFLQAGGEDLTWTTYADTPDEARTSIWAKASAWFGGVDDISLSSIEEGPTLTISAPTRSAPLRLVA